MPRDPIAQFKKWFALALAQEPSNPDALALATISPDGIPAVRMVLLKLVDARGFVFYTNLNSAKAQDLHANPVASMCFYWKSLDRQVRITGAIEAVGDEEADAYFASRARVSQLGAWASRQSHVMQESTELEMAVAQMKKRFDGQEVPRPKWWSGFRLRPDRVEFWEQGDFRLHRRQVFIRDDEDWSTHWLYP